MPIGSADFRLSASDFVDAYKMARAPTKRGWIILLLIAAVSGISVALYRREPLLGVAVFAGCFVGGVVGGAVERKAFTPWRARRIYKRQPFSHRALHIELLDEGLLYRSEGGETRVKWTEIIKWRSNDIVTLPYLSPVMFLIVPARLKGVGFPLEALQAALARAVGPRRR